MADYTTPHKVTKKQFKYFKECFCDMAEALGLKEYRLHFEFCEVEGGYGSCSADLDGKIAIIELNTIFEGWEATDANVKEVAQHECLELLMWEMHELSSSRFTTKDRLEAARHGVIRRLEKLL